LNAWLSNLGLVLACGVVGGVCGFLAQPAASQAACLARPVSEAASPLPTSEEHARLRDRLLALEQRLALLERGSAQQPSNSAVPTSAEPERDKASSPVIDDGAAWQRTLDELAQEPVDRSWARGAEADLARDLEGLGAGSAFHVASSRCASVHCLATLEFPAGVTDRDFERVLHHAYTAQCAKTVHVQPPQDGIPSTTLSLLLDCGP